jgi:hypothetical protein
VTFKPNPGFEAELRKSASFRAAMRGEAGRAAREARKLAPQGETGGFAASIVAFDDGEMIGIRTTDPFGHLGEFGSVNNRPYAPLRRGVVAAGLRLQEQPK